MSGRLERLWRSHHASWAPELTSPIFAAGLARLEREIPPGARVLDLGCGSGWLGSIFGRFGYRAYGVDLDHRLLARAQADPRPSLACATVERLPFAAGCFDAVFSYSVLQYAERSAALAEAVRVLRPGGLLILAENLHGHPLPRLFRAWMRWRRGYPRFGAPRSHLRWTDRTVFESALEDVRCVAFNFSTPVLHAWSGMAGRMGIPVPSANAYAAWHAFDRRWLGTFPIAARWCWHALIVGRRRVS